MGRSIGSHDVSLYLVDRSTGSHVSLYLMDKSTGPHDVSSYLMDKSTGPHDVSLYLKDKSTGPHDVSLYLMDKSIGPHDVSLYLTDKNIGPHDVYLWAVWTRSCMEKPRSSVWLGREIRSVAARNQWNGPMKSVLKSFHRSVPLLSRSDRLDLMTKSESGLGTLLWKSDTKSAILLDALLVNFSHAVIT